jgi:hypothetical protein
LAQELVTEERLVGSETALARETTMAIPICRGEPGDINDKGFGHSSILSEEDTTEHAVSELSSAISGREESAISGEEAPATVETLQHSPFMMTSNSDASSEVEMPQGQPISMSRENAFIRAGRLHLHVEYPAQTAIVHHIQTVEHRTHVLEWLNESGESRLDGEQELGVVDIEHLKEEKTYDMVDQGGLLIVDGKVVVRLALQNEKL